MSDEAGFLKSIAEQPKERSVRLVYADWLDEHDRPREAEFLRLRIQVAELSARLIELGGPLDVKWLGAVGNVRVEPQWFQQRSGRSVLLREFRQRDFYEGLLEGVPSSEDNRESLERLVHEEGNRRGWEPYLIQPVERPVPRRAADPFPEPRGLFPTTACVARFDSFEPARDKSRHASELTVIWFQHEWAFPIDPGVREQIRAIDWDQHAHDFDW
jgi:uncharacterized protein (TIGR02996 family)